MKSSKNKRRITLLEVLVVCVIVSIVFRLGWHIYNWEEVKRSFLNATPFELLIAISTVVLIRMWK